MISAAGCILNIIYKKFHISHHNIFMLHQKVQHPPYVNIFFFFTKVVYILTKQFFEGVLQK